MKPVRAPIPPHEPQWRVQQPTNSERQSALLPGIIVAAFGRNYLVETPDGQLLTCTTRGKRGNLACGDHVAVGRTAPRQGVIEGVDPRSTLFYRSDKHRQKLLAANVTQAVIVVAPWPPFSEDLLNRCLVAAEHAGARSLVVLNKADMDEAGSASDQLALYGNLGYDVIAISAKHDVDVLRPHLAGQTSVLVGESGMGKSTIVNTLLPGARAAIAEVSRYLETGRHATTHARLYRLDAESRIVDAPGIQEFGLHHLDWRDLAHAFVEFRPFLSQCRFADCRHLREPDCAVARGAEGGWVSTRRLATYRRLLKDVEVR